MPTYITSHFRSFSLTETYSDNDQPLVITTFDNWLQLVTTLKSRLTETEFAEIFDDTFTAFTVYISDDAHADHPAG